MKTATNSSAAKQQRPVRHAGDADPPEAAGEAVWQRGAAAAPLGALEQRPDWDVIDGPARDGTDRRPAQQQSMSPVLVTGASGYAGGRLAARLRHEGYTVRALVRPSASTAHLTRIGVELVEGDVRRRADVERAAAGVTGIYHVAAVFRTARHPDDHYYDVNVGGTEHVLAAADRWQVKRVVHCSTIGVHGDVIEIPCTEESPFNPGDVYQRSKLEGEQRIRAAIAAGFPACIVRPAGIYGPGDLRLLKLFKVIRSGRFRMFGSGETFWHGVYIDDLVEGFLLCGRHPDAVGGTFIVAGERYVSLNELVEGIGEAVERRWRGQRLPFWPLLAGAMVCETLCRPLRIEPPLHRRQVEFFTENRAFSIEHAHRQLGYQPQVDLAEGLRRTAAWYFEHGYLT